MKNTDVYGFGSRALEIARDLLEKRFGIKFEPREGGYMGGDYYFFERPDGEEWTLQRNYNSLEKEWFEGDAKSQAVILYVEGTERSDEIAKGFEGLKEVVLLRRDPWED